MTGDLESISEPAPLTGDHDLAAFDSGEPTLDKWLREHALDNEQKGGSRTFVVCAEGRVVVGFYALAAGSVEHERAPGRIRRNMPTPIPVMVLGRLAVDKKLSGRGLGQGLLRDAIRRTVQVAQMAGIRALLVHAISDNAKRFYLRHGFRESPIDPMTLMITLADALAALKD
jgi:GNAT superfamily N-acetyltransferase